MSLFGPRVAFTSLGTRYAHADVRGSRQRRARSSPEQESKRRRVVKIVAWLVGLVVFLAVLHLLGVDVWGWLTELWDTVDEISIGYLILGCIFQAIADDADGARLVRDPALRLSRRRHVHGRCSRRTQRVSP